MEDFLIGTGIALLLVLLGWSEQIKSWHKDTIETEKQFNYYLTQITFLNISTS